MARKKTNQQNTSRRGSKKTAKSTQDATGPQRLQRVMASAGIGSRRECELIIQEGRVEVDGEIVVELGTKVDPEKQEIYVDAELLVVEKLQYFMLNKPPGIVSTSNDPSGRVRVIDLIKTEQRVYNVGRLDQSSEGLILVTNDGDLANKLTHPRYGVEKKYHVQVAGTPTPSKLRALEKGVYIAEGKAKASSVRFLRRDKNSSWIEIVLTEGRNREIRRMLSSIGHKVRKLKRVAVGPLKMGDLPVGAHRPLTGAELRLLRKAADGEWKPRRKKKTSTKKKSSKAKSKRDEAGGQSGRSDKKSQRKSAKSKSTKRPTRKGARKKGASSNRKSTKKGESQGRRVARTKKTTRKKTVKKPKRKGRG